MGRQRNDPQLKGKVESPERVLNEIKASKLSDIEFKIMMLKELSENYKELYGCQKELTGNYISMKNDIETINKSQEEMKNTVSEKKNILEGIKSKLDKTDHISDLENKVEKITPRQSNKMEKDSKT